MVLLVRNCSLLYGLENQSPGHKFIRLQPSNGHLCCEVYWTSRAFYEVALFLPNVAGYGWWHTGSTLPFEKLPEDPILNVPVLVGDQDIGSHAFRFLQVDERECRVVCRWQDDRIRFQGHENVAAPIFG